MARPLRIEFSGAIYHLTSRGNARELIYLDDQDRQNFLRILAAVVDRFEWRCHAYCLMGNHYHLMVETPHANLSKGMRQLNGVYTQAFNRRHKRVGHLFQGRYKAITVDKDSYLLELCRYVVLNPVRAEMVRHPSNWPWSSYQATAGETSSPEFLTSDWVLDQFTKRRSTAYDHYRRFIQDGMGQSAPWDDITGQVLLGNQNFIDKLRPDLQGNETELEIPKQQRLMGRPSLNALLPSAKIHDLAHRNSAVRSACLEYGYSQAEVARYLDLHYTTISKVLREP